MRLLPLLTLSFLLTSPLAAKEVPITPQEALKDFYSELQGQIDLPVAPPAAAALSPDTRLTQIAFGSCNSERREQHMWGEIMAKNPQLFMLIGDNVYGDTNWTGDAELSTLRRAYAKQSAHPEFAAFRQSVPMLTTWDDHDYGYNDGGGSFGFKQWAETIYETYWDSADHVKGRPGIYDSQTYGVDGEKVQIILLDTRYFRSDMQRQPYAEKRPPLGPYKDTRGDDVTMLGEAQWYWLEQELAKPADLRIVVSSVQVITQAHQYESWAVMSQERLRLLDMLGAREESGLLLLSGDRHAGGIYKLEHGGETLWELTSSSLNLAFSTTQRSTAREPDADRVTDFIAEENFGTIQIDWAARSLGLQLLGNEGEVRAEKTVGWGS